MGLKVGSVKTSEIPGLYEVQFANGPLVYSTPRVTFSWSGDMFLGGTARLRQSGAEKRRDGERMEKLAAVAQLEDMIVFHPRVSPGPISPCLPMSPVSTARNCTRKCPS